MARKRAEDALAKLVAGMGSLLRREPRTPYNGAEGVPIREEVLSRQGEVVVTRNAYGAQCLNTPDVAFADIDFDYRPRLRRVLAHGVVLLLVAAWVTAWSRSGAVAFFAALLALVSCAPLAIFTQKLSENLRGGPVRSALARVRGFSRRHPDWLMRLYRTPAGLRVLVMHRTFRADSPEITDFFARLGVDPFYARMCRNQQCFRARLTPKPWRIGLGHHMRPRPGVWPIKDEHMERRQAWIREYEDCCGTYAACEFLESLGSGVIHPEAALVAELHDRVSQALTGRAIA